MDVIILTNDNFIVTLRELLERKNTRRSTIYDNQKVNMYRPWTTKKKSLKNSRDGEDCNQEN